MMPKLTQHKLTDMLVFCVLIPDDLTDHTLDRLSKFRRQEGLNLQQRLEVDTASPGYDGWLSLLSHLIVEPSLHEH